jgi:hypothetical protein
LRWEKVAKIKEKHLQYALYALIAVGIIVTAYVVVSSGRIGPLFATPSPTVTPNTPKIGVIALTFKDCRQCFDVQPLADGIVKALVGAEVENKSLDYRNASDLIAKYGVKKVPAVIVTGEIDKVPSLKQALLPLAEQAPDGSLVLTRPVYFDLQTQKFIGMLKITKIVNGSCYECTKAFDFQKNIEQGIGISFSDETEWELNDSRAIALIQQYNITKIPSIVITGEIDEYKGLKEEWLTVGNVESDGALVWRSVPPVYESLPSKQIKGMVTLIGIVNSSCKQCYNVRLHENELTSEGIYVANTTYLESNSTWAKNLIKKYDIDFVPTVVIDKELEEYYPYTQIKDVWAEVGSFESDGWKVFRRPEKISGNVTIQNLTTGEIQNVTTQSG